jgi:hypothetical protein
MLFSCLLSQVLESMSDEDLSKIALLHLELGA